MSSFNRPRVFDALDLEVIARVYEAAWAQVEARDFTRDESKEEEHKQALRERLFALAGSGPVDFDTLYDKVTADISVPWAKPVKKPRGSRPHAGA